MIFDFKQKRVWRNILLFSVACIAIFLLYPVKSTVCPLWKIQVVDEAGSPLKNTFVTQHWKDYSVQSMGEEQGEYTDENGYVSFPERTIRVSRLFRTLGVILNSLSLGVHASYGAHAYILAFGDIVEGKRLEGSASYEEGKPLPERLVTRVRDLHL